MTPAEAMAVAVHRNRHRVSEPGYGGPPCGPCRQESASLQSALPDGFVVTSEEDWRREHGSRSAAERRYREGVSDGTAAERERIALGLRELGLA